MATRRRPCIMVVDDDRETLNIVGRTLTLERFDVITASDGASALTMLDTVRPDLVILDIMMPDLDGFQTLSLIREHLDTPVIMLTARAEMELLEQALGLGADDYITKPFRTLVLLARIKAKLRRARRGVPAPVVNRKPSQLL